MPAIHESDKFICSKALRIFYWANQVGILTDAVINPLTTKAGLQGVFTSAGNIAILGPNEVHQLRTAAEAVDQMGDTKGLAVFTDTNIAAANTFAALMTLITDAAGFSADEIATLKNDGSYWDNGSFIATDIL